MKSQTDIRKHRITGATVEVLGKRDALRTRVKFLSVGGRIGLIDTEFLNREWTKVKP